MKHFDATSLCCRANICVISLKRKDGIDKNYNLPVSLTDGAGLMWKIIEKMVQRGSLYMHIYDNLNSHI